jgi:hypothetical protein
MSSYLKYKQSRFVTKGDLDSDEMLVTITSVSEENVSLPGEPKRIKACLQFEELDKPFVCNWTNLEALARITRSGDTEDWPGHQVILYFDPSVRYGTETKGGLRLKAVPKPAPLKNKGMRRPVAVAADEPEDRTDYGPPDDL